MFRRLVLVCSVVLSLALALGGCGGGEGGRGGGPPPPCIPIHGEDCVTAQAFRQSAEALIDGYASEDGFRNQWGLEHMNAGRAYANLELLEGASAEPGEGVTLGFIDSGIDHAHTAFAGKTVTEQFLSGGADETGAGRFSHGTAVASVAAGGKDSSSNAAWGVASGADIAMFSVPTGSGGGDYVPITVARLDAVDDRWAQAVNTVLGWRRDGRRVDILNVSVGHNGIIDNYTGQQLRENLERAIAAMAQAGAGEKTLFVWAAGNAHGRSCADATPNCESGSIDAVSVEVLPGLAARIPELRGHTVAVVALSSSGSIASFSSRCGIAAAYCIAAAGQDVRAAYFGPDPDPNAAPDTVIRGYAGGLRGTSFSAPMVAGGLALMKQVFRDQLSNTELVSRLFETADDSGRYADSAVYGHGAMDLGAATSPVGVLEVPGANRMGQNGFSLRATRLSTGTAFGDGLERSLATRQLMALDSLGAPFWYPLGSFAASAGALPVGARLRGFLARDPGRPGGVSASAEGPSPELRLHAERLEAPARFRGSHMALAEGGLRATVGGWGGLSGAAFTTNGIAGRNPVAGTALSWRRASWPVGVRVGWIGERETLLGSVGEGAFGGLSSDAAFAGLDVGTELGRWRVRANAELGRVAPKTGEGLLRGVSVLTTSAFALHATRGVAGLGAVRLSVSQPLRVEHGQAWLRVPEGRTKGGAVQYVGVGAGLEPSGRQVDVAGEWQQALGRGAVSYTHLTLPTKRIV